MPENHPEPHSDPETLTCLLRHTVTPDEDGVTLRELVRRHLAPSRRLFRQLKRESGILVNGEPRRAYERANTGDELVVVVGEQPSGVLPEEGPLRIVYEDRELLIVDKPAGVVSHPVKEYVRGTLANWVAGHLTQAGTPTKVRPVNRLDKDTSGLIVFAKTAHAQSRLDIMRAKGLFARSYLAVVHGIPSPAAGVIDVPIGLSRTPPGRRAAIPEGQPSVTRYEVVEYGNGWSLVRLSLETGRTHQVRVHMAHIGHPLMGDPFYGDSQADSAPDPISRQALHAFKIRLVHPRTGEPLEFTSPIPEDMLQLLEILRGAEPNRVAPPGGQSDGRKR